MVTKLNVISGINRKRREPIIVLPGAVSAQESLDSLYAN